jgi:hypothetical protein
LITDRSKVVELQQELEEARSHCDAQKNAYEKQLAVERQRIESLQKHWDHEVPDPESIIADHGN